MRGDRAQRAERMREEARQPDRPEDRHDREHQRHARGAPAADDRGCGERRHERARVERRELARVRPECTEDEVGVRPCELADAGRVAHSRGGRREAHELEPRQDRDRGEPERHRPGAREDRETAPAELQHEHDERRGGRDERELLRAAQDRERERPGQDQRRRSAPLARRGVLRRGHARREPGGARQQPERLRAGQQVAAGAERDARVHRAQAPGAAEARERVRRERREQVVERDEGDHPARRGQEAVRHECRRVEHARLRIGGEGMARERERVPEREVAVAQALVQERGEGRVEGVRVVRVRQIAQQRQRREHQYGDQDADRDGGQLARPRARGKADARERYLYGRAPTCEFRRGAHASARVDDPT